MQAPYIPPEVLAWLEHLFPGRVPEDPLTEKQYDVLVGQQQVVGRVRREVQRQANDLTQV